MGPSNKVDYDIHTLAVGRFLDLFREILLDIVDGMRRPIWEREQPIQLVLG